MVRGFYVSWICRIAACPKDLRNYNPRALVIARGQRPRSNPICPSKYLSISKQLFISRNHNKLSVRAIQRALDKRIKEAGIQTKYSPHALRRTFGTELFSRCKNIRLVQDLMGHSNISTTMIYTHVSKDEMKDAVELLTT